jgi:hypothetical protein
MPIERHRSLVLSLIFSAIAYSSSATAQDVKLAPGSEAEIVFDSAQKHCDENDMPDVNARAFRDASGDIVMFALYDSNHALRGKDIDHLAIDCHASLESRADPNPAHYDDRNFLTATWTKDGRNVVGLVHHEYHADQHGRCSVKSDLGCWYNSVLAYLSTDSGENFTRAKPLVVASVPFPQNVGQGSHRGFFNPSNIFSDGQYEYFFAATTGWDGQPFGACLFRSATPEDSASWRAYDGQDFTVHYDDPYKKPFSPPASCAPLSPFVFPVGAVVRERDTGLWLAVFQASHNADVYPVDGFYYAEAEDLLHWSEPRLLLAGPTLYTNPCDAGSTIIAYPSLIDPTAKGRNFDDVGPSPFLYYAIIDVANCETDARRLVRQRLSISSTLDRSP